MASPITKPRRRLTKAPRRTADSARDLLSGIDASKLGARGRALLASARREDRPVSANMVPGLGQAVRSLAGSTRGQSAVPRSARPIGPLAQAQSVVSNLLNQSEAGNALRSAARRATGTRTMTRPSRGPFRAGVRLDPSQVSDRRTAAPRRDGASSSTSRGPLIIRRHPKRSNSGGGASVN